MASPAAWAQEARQAAGERLTSLPSLTGQEEVWRFTQPADLALDGAEPQAPGAVSSVAVEGGVRAARLRLLDGAPSAPELVEVADGVLIAELGAALEEHECLIRDRLYGLVGFDQRPEALNAAHWDGGLAVGGLDDLYQDLILDRHRRKRGEGSLENPTVAVDQTNPLCGDEVHLELGIVDGRVMELAHTGDGCSISQASVSMMSEAMSGLSVDEALELVEHFRQMMHGSEEGDEDRLMDAIALQGVAKYPVRVKCALLGWMAAKDAIQTYQRNGG